ncbi:MAG TPA: glycoside hydrolase family 3 N-terminal domain-containing protein, partial [Gemmatimonadales bacterium]|nr:glycoside hydrolase family 3 N-terminal domain-containing protein [Gemmatimonadales bacterium]
MSLCRHAFLSILVFTVITPAGTSAQVRAARSGLAPLPAAERSRVTRLMRTLPLRERIAQLIMPWIPGTYAAFDDRSLEKVRGWVDTLQVGGIIVSVGSPLDIAATLNFFQRRSRLPLLIASDLEGGTSIRFQGGTPFPTNMGVGAGGRVQDAYAMGRVTALEGRAAGIHLTFSPVADVNNNAANPIINTRSFGGNAEAVGRMVAAAVRGIQ